MDATAGSRQAPLTIEVNVVPDVRDESVVHVEGTASLDSGPALPFSGWMSLLEVLEGMIAGATGGPTA